MKIEIWKKYNVKQMIDTQVFTAKIMSERKLWIFWFYRYCEWNCTDSLHGKTTIEYWVIRERNILYKL